MPKEELINMADGIEPLFRSSSPIYSNGQFIANIGDELSLWHMPLEGLRIYPANNWGYWVLGLRAKLTKGDDPPFDPHDPKVKKVLRHIDTIELYAAMLEKGLTDAT